MALAVSVIRSIWLISPLNVLYIAFIVDCMSCDTVIIGGNSATSCPSETGWHSSSVTRLSCGTSRPLTTRTNY
jgi:hypothetical protein